MILQATILLNYHALYILFLSVTSQPIKITIDAIRKSFHCIWAFPAG